MPAASRVKVLLKTFGGYAARVAILFAASQVDPSGALTTQLKALIEALTTARVTGSSISQPVSVTTTSAAGAYEDDQDKASLTFRSNDGSYHSIRIPAPIDAAFQANKEDIDLTNAAVIAFAGYVTTNCVSPTGASLTTLVGGKRIRLNAGRRS